MQYSIEKATEILERTPRILNSFLKGLSVDWTQCNEGENTWSPYDVVGHLIHGEKTDWMIRLKMIKNNSEKKTFEPFDRFAQFEDSKDKSLDELLIAFAQLRQDNLDDLKSLNISNSDFERKGIHPDLGEVSLKNLLATWVAHDLGHIAQIARVMAKQYKAEVGPWVTYLSIINK